MKAVVVGLRVLLAFVLFSSAVSGLLFSQDSEAKPAQVLRTELAGVSLELAEVELQLAEEFNREVGSVLLTNLSKEDRESYAEEKVRLAEIQLETMRRYREKGLPVKDGEIRRMELKLQQAQLNRRLLDSPENLLEIDDSLQRQVDRLNEELIRHDQRLSAVEDSDK